MKLLLICGPWGSGTSTVAGMLERLGAFGLGPYLKTNDPFTPNSYESMPFRRLVLHYVSESEVKLLPHLPSALATSLRGLRDRIMGQSFGPYDVSAPPPLFLKFPPSALLIPQIGGVFDTHLIYVDRPLAEIERSRLRRKWPPVYGQVGATVIYDRMAAALLFHANPVLQISYPSLLTSPEAHARDLARFAGLDPTEDALRAAIGFVGVRS